MLQNSLGAFVLRAISSCLQKRVSGDSGPGEAQEPSMVGCMVVLPATEHGRVAYQIGPVNQRRALLARVAVDHPATCGQSCTFDLPEPSR